METEGKQQKFRRLAMTRGNRLLRDIELLGNLSNRNNYEYTEDQVRIIFSTIEEELRVAKRRFSGGKEDKREIVL